MNPQTIERESKNLLKFVAPGKYGFIVNNEIHKKENFVYIGNDFLQISERIKKGWELKPGDKNWILRAPEFVLVDLSEFSANLTRQPHEILTLYRILKRLDLKDLISKIIKQERWSDIEIIPLKGASSQAEIRVACSDIRAKKFPKLIYSHLKKTDLWKNEIKQSKALLHPRPLKIYSKSLKDCRAKTKNFYKKVVSQYELLGQKLNEKTAIGGFWNFLNNDADVIIFILKAGLKYALGYLEDVPNNKEVILWEYHLGNDNSKEVIIAPCDIKNKNVLIVDRSYSGGTLAELSEKVDGFGGNASTLSLFPKSIYAIKNANLILFLDKYLKKSQIDLEDDWAEKLFISVINNEI